MRPICRSRKMTLSARGKWSIGAVSDPQEPNTPVQSIMTPLLLGQGLAINTAKLGGPKTMDLLLYLGDKVSVCTLQFAVIKHSDFVTPSVTPEAKKLQSFISPVSPSKRRKRNFNLPDYRWYENKTPANKYETNMWYNYATFLAKEKNKTRCYVCTKLPASAGHPAVVVTPVPYSINSSYFPDILPSAQSKGVLSVYLKNFSTTPTPAFKGRNFTKFLSLNWTTTVLLKGVPYPNNMNVTCFTNNLTLGTDGSIVGNIPLKYCHQTLTPCTRLSNGSYNTTLLPTGAKCADYYNVPDALGTYPQADVYFMCANTIHLALPPAWRGRCALVQLSGESFIMEGSEGTARRRREVAGDPHDSVWGTDVPDDHKLWSTGQKIVLSALPFLGVGKVMLRVETLHYRMTAFINATVKALKGLAEEVGAIREMELQDRTVLDVLTASQGGVCAIIGQHCCTYIPDNTGTEGQVTQAIGDLKKLADAMEKDHADTAQSMWSWFTSGPWWQLLLKVLTPLVIVLILFCAFTMCVVPCFKSMMSRMISDSVSTALHSDMEFLILDPDDDGPVDYPDRR